MQNQFIEGVNLQTVLNKSLDMVIAAAAISVGLDFKWWICINMTFSIVLLKCTVGSSMLNKNYKFENQSPNHDLHTSALTLCSVLKKGFLLLSTTSSTFWSSFSNIFPHTLHDNLHFCFFKAWDFKFWSINMHQTQLHPHLSHLTHAFENLEHLFWFVLSKVQAINREGYFFHDKLINMPISHLRALSGEIKWKK